VKGEGNFQKKNSEEPEGKQAKGTMMKTKIFLKPIVFFLTLSFASRIGVAAQEASLPADATDYYQRKDYVFTQDWTRRNTALWTQALMEFKGKPNVRYLEIGVFEGRSVLWMLENILTHPTAKATCIDRFPDEFPGIEQRFKDNLKKSGSKEKVQALKGFSSIQLRTLPLASFDIIYVDAGHTAKETILDAALSWDLLKRGGIMIFDDYGWEVERPEFAKPKIAVDFFVHAFDPKILFVGYQYIVRKY
jgi:predicted O-methyltransferase YrrM